MLPFNSRPAAAAKAAPANIKDLLAARIDELLVGGSGRDFVDIGQRCPLDAGRAAWRREVEDLRGDGDARLPVPQPQGVLGTCRKGLAGDDVFSRQGTFARLNPDLPVRVEVAESQVITLYTVHDSLADDTAFENARGKLLEGIREQEVRPGDLHCQVASQFVHQLVE